MECEERKMDVYPVYSRSMSALSLVSPGSHVLPLVLVMMDKDTEILWRNTIIRRCPSPLCIDVNAPPPLPPFPVYSRNILLLSLVLPGLYVLALVLVVIAEFSSPKSCGGIFRVTLTHCVYMIYTYMYSDLTIKVFPMQSRPLLVAYARGDDPASRSPTLLLFRHRFFVRCRATIRHGPVRGTL